MTIHDDRIAKRANDVYEIVRTCVYSTDKLSGVATIESAMRSAASLVVGGHDLTLIGEILDELQRARAKFPGKNVTFAALVEEVGELAAATFEESRARVRKEVVQVAVMAMRMVLDGDHTFDDWLAGKGLDPLTDAAGASGCDGMTPETWGLFNHWENVDIGSGYSFKYLERKTGLPRNIIRGHALTLSHLGFLEFRRGCFTEDGEPYGCAYVLTNAGYAALHPSAPHFAPPPEPATRDAIDKWIEGGGNADYAAAKMSAASEPNKAAEGRRAYQSGLLKEQNPYPEGSAKYWQWSSGWLDERAFRPRKTPSPHPVNDAELIDGLDPAYGGGHE